MGPASRPFLSATMLVSVPKSSWSFAICVAPRVLPSRRATLSAAKMPSSEGTITINGHDLPFTPASTAGTTIAPAPVDKA